MQQHVVEHPPRHAAHAVGDPDGAVRRRARAPAPALVGRPPRRSSAARARRGTWPTAPRRGDMSSSSDGRRRRSWAARRATMRAHPLALLRPREPRGDRHDRPVALAVGGHRAHALARAADLDLRQVLRGLHRCTLARQAPDGPRFTRRRTARPARFRGLWASRSTTVDVARAPVHQHARAAGRRVARSGARTPREDPMAETYAGRVLLREVQGEARGRGRRRRLRIRSQDGQGRLPGVRHQAEPDPRQGLSTTTSPEGIVRDGRCPSACPGLWTTADRGPVAAARVAPDAERGPMRLRAGLRVLRRTATEVQVGTDPRWAVRV